MSESKWLSPTFIAVSAVILMAALATIPWLRSDHLAVKISIDATDYQDAIEARGSIDTSSFETLKAPDSELGTQLVYLFPDGQPLKKGEDVARFDISQVENKIEDFKEQIRTFEANLQETKNMWANHYEQVDNAIFRVTEEVKLNEIALATTKFESKLKRDEVEVQRNHGISRLSTQQKLKKRFVFWRNDSIRNLQRQIDTAHEEIIQHRELMEQYVLRAPFDTMVRYPNIKIAGKRRRAEPGDTLVRVQEFGRLPDFSTSQVRLYVPEKRIEEITKGMRVEFAPVSHPSPLLHGRVTSTSSVSSLEFSRPGYPLYRVRVEIDPKDATAPGLAPGATVHGRVLLASHTNVFPIPRYIVDTSGDDLRLTDEHNRRVDWSRNNLVSLADHYLLPAGDNDTLRIAHPKDSP